MAAPWKVFGSDNSPYSIKVRSFFRYKGVAHTWLVRNMQNQAEFEKVAKLPLVPAVASPEGEAMQDSTPIMEAVEARYPEPAGHPPGALLRFVSELLEEFADEWGNKWMFHYRWAAPADQDAVSRRIVAEMLGAGADAEQVEQMAGMVKARMSGRGSSGQSKSTRSSGRLSTCASQSRVTISSSVHAGDAIQSKPMTFSPAHSSSPITAGYDACGLK